tara:strand:+ start:1134 stop:1799 length:666 start_codon:yes stop_codon:yes gene_type:complete
MKIQELADKYDLTKDDFWELRKNSNKWIITHDACEKIAVTEGIAFDPMVVVSYVPTIITENGEKVIKVAYGKEKFTPAWAGTCQKKTGDVALTIVGYKKDSPDYKIESNGEANATNCTSNYYFSMALKRAQDRVILKLINAYEYGIYSDVEADNFAKHDKMPTEPQLDKLHNLASELNVELVGVEKLNREECSAYIDKLEDRQNNKRAEENAREKQIEIGS